MWLSKMSGNHSEKGFWMHQELTRIFRVPTEIWKQNSMTFPWLNCCFPWLPFWHGFQNQTRYDGLHLPSQPSVPPTILLMTCTSIIISIWAVSDQGTIFVSPTPKIQNYLEHKLMQFHDFSMTFHKFSKFPDFSLTFHDHKFFQDFPGFSMTVGTLIIIVV